MAFTQLFWGTGKLSIRMTLLHYWVLATLIAILPLFFAAGYSAVALHKQIDLQQQLMGKQELLTEQTSQLGEQVNELIRTSRQYNLLGEPSFLKLFEQHRSAVEDTLAQLDRLNSNASLADLLEKISTSTNNIQKLLISTAPGKVSDNLNASLLALREDSGQLKQMADKLRRVEMGQLEADFHEIVSGLLFLLLPALPVALLLVLTGSYIISRPILQLTAAIRQLGQNKFNTPIRVKGPTDLSELGDQLDWMRRQILATDHQKAAFVQHVTHELKTPLAAIIDAGSMLSEEIPATLDPEQKPIVEILLQNAWNLQQIIQQLLNYNAVTHGLAVRTSPVNITTICKNIQKNLLTSDPGTSTNWRFIGRPECLDSDPRLLEMILGNLLTNAAQYSGNGGTVVVSWSDQPDCWTLSVHDNGPGIAENELDEIFLPFFRGSCSKRHRRPHSGVGLAIVKSCVELMKGDIRVSSAPDQGTTFLMKFPRHTD